VVDNSPVTAPIAFVAVVLMCRKEYLQEISTEVKFFIRSDEMAEEKSLIIHFMDGSKMSVTFPKQAEFAHQIVRKTQQALENNQLAFEAGNDLFVIPMSSIKYLQVSPAADNLPDSVIRGATLTSDL
jgi:hypothetical protein